MLNKSQTKLSRSQALAGKTYLSTILPVVFIFALVAFGVVPRVSRQVELGIVHNELETAAPAVSAISVASASAQSRLVLPGDIEPIQNIPIYARVGGYLTKRLVDIGDKVKQGQLLAVIDTPELDHQLEQAKADLGNAQANLTMAIADRKHYASALFAAQAAVKQARTNLAFSQTEVKRYQSLAAEGAVSYEARDQKVRNANSDEASLEAAGENEKSALAQVVSYDARIASAKQQIAANAANVRRLEALQGFQNVVAPADGVITRRFVDAGALVAAGGENGTTELLSMAKTDTLRIYVNVPQSDYVYIHNGDKAEILLQEFPGKVFYGQVTNISGSLDPNSRTRQTEIHIPNSQGQLTPGVYADVRFVFNRKPPVVVPSNAVVTLNDGVYAALVKNGVVEYQKIEIARDFGNRLEVSTGLEAGDLVLLDPPDDLHAGDKVKPIIAQSTNVLERR